VVLRRTEKCICFSAYTSPDKDVASYARMEISVSSKSIAVFWLALIRIGVTKEILIIVPIVRFCENIFSPIRFALFVSDFNKYTARVGHAVAKSVEALRYKPEDRGFYSRWCHLDFALT
jgi:hypothetical protein